MAHVVAQAAAVLGVPDVGVVVLSFFFFSEEEEVEAEKEEATAAVAGRERGRTIAGK